MLVLRLKGGFLVCAEVFKCGGLRSSMPSIFIEGIVDLKILSEYEKQTDHDVIAFLRAVTDSLSDKDAARYVHLGLTSSDVVDTALALQMREAMEVIIEDVTWVRVTLAGL